MTRDESQRQAIHLLGEHHGLLKTAKASAMPERAAILCQAAEKARAAQRAVDRFHRISMKGVQP